MVDRSPEPFASSVLTGNVEVESQVLIWVDAFDHKPHMTWEPSVLVFKLNRICELVKSGIRCDNFFREQHLRCATNWCSWLHWIYNWQGISQPGRPNEAGHQARPGWHDLVATLLDLLTKVHYDVKAQSIHSRQSSRTSKGVIGCRWLARMM
jgi:hypothetical protein